MISFNVLRVMQLRGIVQPYTFLSANGFTHHTAHRLTKGSIKSISFAHLEKLCRILNCEPNDLLDYQRTDRTVLPESDRLAFLTKEHFDTKRFHQLIAEIPLDRIPSIADDLAERYRKAG